MPLNYPSWCFGFLLLCAGSMHASPQAEPLRSSPIFTLGEDSSTDECSGSLFDSGGSGGDYGNNQNLSFTICPQDEHHCIVVNVAFLALEQDFDFLYFFAGPDAEAPLFFSLTGSTVNFEMQFPGPCLTILFTSDGAVTDAGFELSWYCMAEACTTPPPSNCNNPTVIPSLPFLAQGLSTCSAGNNYMASPCSNDDWLATEDVVFTYDSPGGECISVQITGASPGTGMGIFSNCPDTPGECIASVWGGFNQPLPQLESVFLEQPGTYYIVVDNSDQCTAFNIEVQPQQCPVVFPAAPFCEAALSLNGCGELPAIVRVAPGQGDPNFIQSGLNGGCWGAHPPNFTWFYFEAQANGEFGFVMQAAGASEASDLDFQVWGAFSNPAEACDLIKTSQPLRSSFADVISPTGLANWHPLTGNLVTDTCETAAGDAFVKTLNVEKGKFYYVLLNDWGGAITSGAVSIDFYPTSPGVLNAQPSLFTLTPDTLTCPGGQVQLSAGGGALCEWFPSQGLSCTSCLDPLALVTDSITYHAAIHNLCASDTLEVHLGLLHTYAGADLTLCLDGTAQLEAPAGAGNAGFNWTAPSGFLSCTGCPNPLLTGLSAGQFVVELAAAFPQCTVVDSMVLTVLPYHTPTFTIAENQSICIGDSVFLGGIATPGVTYSWISAPPGFFSTEANPLATPAVSCLYLLEVLAESCPIPAFDSVFITATAPPLIAVLQDTTICEGESVLLGSTLPEPEVHYEWSPTWGLNDSTLANPLAMPTQSTLFILRAARMGCVAEDSVFVEVIEPEIALAGARTISVCAGAEVVLSVLPQPGATTVTWSSDDGTLQEVPGPEVLVRPYISGNYIAAISTECLTAFDTIFVGVLPGIEILEITGSPPDTAYVGTRLQLGLVTMPPAAAFQWSNGSVADTAQVLVQAAGSAVFAVTVTDSSGCTDMDSVVITVLEPKFDIPNAFSPNGDELNQNFQVLIAGQNIAVLSMQVWDRWGQLVYEEKNGNKGWDGQFKDQPAASDIYVYRILLLLPDGTKILKTGDLTLLR